MTIGFTLWLWMVFLSRLCMCQPPATVTQMYRKDLMLSPPGSRSQQQTDIQESNAHDVSVCRGHMRSITCPNLELLHIFNAFYGKLSGHDCEVPITHFRDQMPTCFSKDAPNIIRESCQGQQSCDLYAEDTLYSDPCPTVRKYLYVSFTCQGKSRLPEILKMFQEKQKAQRRYQIHQQEILKKAKKENLAILEIQQEQQQNQQLLEEQSRQELQKKQLQRKQEINQRKQLQEINQRKQLQEKQQLQAMQEQERQKIQKQKQLEAQRREQSLLQQQSQQLQQRMQVQQSQAVLPNIQHTNTTAPFYVPQGFAEDSALARGFVPARPMAYGYYPLMIPQGNYFPQFMPPPQLQARFIAPRPPQPQYFALPQQQPQYIPQPLPQMQYFAPPLIRPPFITQPQLNFMPKTSVHRTSVASLQPKYVQQRTKEVDPIKYSALQLKKKGQTPAVQKNQAPPVLKAPALPVRKAQAPPVQKAQTPPVQKAVTPPVQKAPPVHKAQAPPVRKTQAPIVQKVQAPAVQRTQALGVQRPQVQPLVNVPSPTVNTRSTVKTVAKAKQDIRFYQNQVSEALNSLYTLYARVKCDKCDGNCRNPNCYGCGGCTPPILQKHSSYTYTQNAPSDAQYHDAFANNAMALSGLVLYPFPTKKKGRSPYRRTAQQRDDVSRGEKRRKIKVFPSRIRQILGMKKRSSIQNRNKRKMKGRHRRSVDTLEDEWSPEEDLLPEIMDVLYEIT